MFKPIVNLIVCSLAFCFICIASADSPTNTATCGFAPKPKDIAYTPDGSDEFYNIWDSYFFSENGYKVSFILGSRKTPLSYNAKLGDLKKPWASIIITTPDGTTHERHQTFPPDSFHASGEKLEVVIGDNTLSTTFDKTGKLQEITGKIEVDGLGLDLRYSNLANGFKFSDREDGLIFFNPSTKKFYGLFYITYKADVTGTLKLDDKTIEVDGFGYSIFNKSNSISNEPMALSNYQQANVWAGDYFITLVDSTALPANKYSHRTRLSICKGNTLLATTSNSFISGDKWVIDSVTNGPYPEVETFRAVEGDIRIQGYLPAGTLWHRQKLNSVGGNANGKNAQFHFVQVSDVEVLITHNNKLEAVNGIAFRESFWLRDWFPFQRE